MVGFRVYLYIIRNAQNKAIMNNNNPSINEAFEAILELVEVEYMD